MNKIKLLAAIVVLIGFSSCSDSTSNNCSQCDIAGNWHLYSGYSENNQNIYYDEFSTISEELNHVNKIKSLYTSDLEKLNISSDVFFSFDEDCTYNLSNGFTNGSYTLIDECTELQLSAFNTNVFNEYVINVYEEWIIRISSIGLLVKM